METQWQSKAQLLELLCNLVKIPSVTGSKAEISLADYLEQELSALSYFKNHPAHIQLHPTDDGRSIVTALVKRNDNVRDTVILVSHFDVVDVQDYGTWKKFAFDPQELTQMFQMNKKDMPIGVQQDLDEGNWLFGRGTMDMKCGLALHMSMVEQACHGTFEGNILLLAVCVEEVNSVGMRTAVPVLLDMAKQFDLEYRVCLNTEPMFTRYPGDRNKYIYTGSIGKVLPGFLCYGKETHVGEPLSGLNANLMASMITCELELNVDFCEVVEGEVTPLPTNLIQKDLKEEYSVQIPHRAVTLFNLFIFEKTMREVIDQLSQLSQKIANRIEEHYATQAVNFAKLERSTPQTIKVNTLTVEQLLNYAIKHHGKEEVERIHIKALENRGSKDDRDMTIRLVDELAILCKELSPMIVLFFAPPYYPAISSRNHSLIQRVAGEMIDYAVEKHHVHLVNQHYFGGLSDLSYVGLQQPVSSIEPLVVNMPLWNKGYSLPLVELEMLNLPVLNLGPVGRDAHKWTERLDVDYAFETLLDMLKTAIHKLLK